MRYALAALFYILSIVPTLALDPSFLWVWDETNITNANKRTKLIDFAAKNGVTTIYMAAENAVQTHVTNLNTFIQQTNQAGIEVELLFGDVCWINPDKSLLPKDDPCADEGTDAKYAAKLAEAATKLKYKPRGVHYDVEAAAYASKYGMKWETNAPGVDTVGVNYQNMLNEILKAVGSSGLIVSADMQQSYNTVSVTVGGHQRPLRNFVMQAAAYTVIMAYHNTAAAIEAAARPFVTYATDFDHPLVIAVEMDANPECPPCSFGTYGANAVPMMKSALDAVSAAFGPGTQIRGYAVESYLGYN